MDIIEIMLRQNPWWKTGNAEGISGLPKRALYGELEKYMADKQIISITGLRRVGKTTLMMQLIDGLLKKVEPSRILYFSFDELLARDENIIDSVIGAYESHVLRGELRDVCIFFDEVNNVSDWQVFLKRYYDLNRGIKFVVSGSSSVLLRRAKESLAGRIYEFVLGPTSFSEYLSIKGIEFSDAVLDSPAIRNELVGYIISGGFPETVRETDFLKVKRYAESVLEKVIFHDIPRVYDVGEPEIMKTIASFIARSPGMIVDFRQLAGGLGITHQTASKYVKYMEKAFILRLLFNRRGSTVASSRKLKKAYMECTTLCTPFFDSEAEFLGIMPSLVENAVCSSISAKSFMRDYYEVDFVHGKLPIEVKYQESPDIRNALKLTGRIRSPMLVVVSKSIEKAEIRGGVRVFYVPLWKFLLYGIREEWK